MAYDKQTWQTGDVVTSAKLNHMEDGIASGGGVLVVGMEIDLQGEMVTLDKTWQEIFEAEFPIIKVTAESPTPVARWIGILYVEVVGNSYVVHIDDSSGQANQFVADSPNGYPSQSMK